MTKLRLSHLLLLLQQSSPEEDHLALVSELLVEGLGILQQSSLKDVRLLSELLSQLAFVQELSGANFREVVRFCLEALATVIDDGLDHMIAHSLYCQLSKVLAVQSKQMPQLVRETPVPSTSMSVRPDSTRDGRASSSLSERGATKRERSWTKARNRESYQAWCAMKAATQCLLMLESFHQLSSESHNTEMTQPLPEKLTRKIPDFALLDLCGSQELMQPLLRSTDVSALEKLLPETQRVSAPGSLSWFTLVGYYAKLLRMSSWSLAGDSRWRLHSHCMSGIVLSKALVMHSFLSQYCSPFKQCAIPKLPKPLASLNTSEEATPMMSAPLSATPESYLMASDNEVSLMWCMQPVVKTQSDTITGLLAFNSKAIRSLLHTNTSLSASGVDVLVLTLTAPALAELQATWDKLATICNGHLSQQALQPLSRSPSRTKRRIIEQAKLGTPQELLVRGRILYYYHYLTHVVCRIKSAVPYLY